ncbi:MAG: hypothetical protein CMM02_00515 [Rhodopirellula sp.]|nr:hypothetical protein [Rhodopirellula sp.]
MQALKKKTVRDDTATRIFFFFCFKRGARGARPRADAKKKKNLPYIFFLFLFFAFFRCRASLVGESWKLDWCRPQLGLGLKARTQIHRRVHQAFLETGVAEHVHRDEARRRIAHELEQAHAHARVDGTQRVRSADGPKGFVRVQVSGQPALVLARGLLVSDLLHVRRLIGWREVPCDRAQRVNERSAVVQHWDDVAVVDRASPFRLAAEEHEVARTAVAVAVAVAIVRRELAPATDDLHHAPAGEQHDRQRQACWVGPLRAVDNPPAVSEQLAPVDADPAAGLAHARLAGERLALLLLGQRERKGLEVFRKPVRKRRFAVGGLQARVPPSAEHALHVRFPRVRHAPAHLALEGAGHRRERADDRKLLLHAVERRVPRAHVGEDGGPVLACVEALCALAKKVHFSFFFFKVSIKTNIFFFWNVVTTRF